MDRNEVFVLVMSRSMFACWYHVGIYARDQSKQISSGSLLSSMLRHCYHLYPYPHMIYMIVSIHICICIDVYLYLYLCHIFASIYQLSQQWKPRPATQWSWSEAETRSGRIPFRHLEKGTTFRCFPDGFGSYCLMSSAWKHCLFYHQSFSVVDLSIRLCFAWYFRMHWIRCTVSTSLVFEHFNSYVCTCDSLSSVHMSYV